MSGESYQTPSQTSPSLDTCWSARTAHVIHVKRSGSNRPSGREQTKTKRNGETLQSLFGIRHERPAGQQGAVRTLWSARGSVSKVGASWCRYLHDNPGILQSDLIRSPPLLIRRSLILCGSGVHRPLLANLLQCSSCLLHILPLRSRSGCSSEREGAWMTLMFQDYCSTLFISRF